MFCQIFFIQRTSQKIIQKYWQERIQKLESDLQNSVDEQDMVYRQRQVNWMKETLMAVVVSEEQGEVAKFQKWGLDGSL